jgi:hypothetical protein
MLWNIVEVTKQELRIGSRILPSFFSFLQYFRVYYTAAVTGMDVDTVERKFALYKQNWLLCCVMLCYVMLCCVVSCHVMSCHVMSCHVMSCHVMSCHVMLCYVMLCYVMLCYVMLCCVVLCCVVLCCVVLCHVMSCHVMYLCNLWYVMYPSRFKTAGNQP